MSRADQLRADIVRLQKRVIRLTVRARRVEEGETDVKEKFDKAEQFMGREEAQRTQHNSAIAYWKEVRETEKRLDEKREELRALLQNDERGGFDVRVVIDDDARSER